MTAQQTPTRQAEDSRYSINDNWGDTRAAIAELVEGFTGNDPTELAEYLDQIKYEADAFLTDLATAGETDELPYTFNEIQRWLDEQKSD